VSVCIQSDKSGEYPTVSNEFSVFHETSFNDRVVRMTSLLIASCILTSE